MKILICFGTRPEAIKMAPVIKAFKENKKFQTIVCITAQHREMLDQVLDFFDIVPDIDLNLMRDDQSLNDLCSNILRSIDKKLFELKPDWVLVHGDTTTSTMVALAAFHLGIKIAHVEAGLRTNNKYSPFPEEINRQITGRLANLHFTPTKKAYESLLNEGIQKSEIYLTGNTIVDALYMGLRISKEKKTEKFDSQFQVFDKSKKLILVTGHRRESIGKGFNNLCEALKIISRREDVEIVYPVHLNPNVKNTVHKFLSNISNIHLIKPVEYPMMLDLLKDCDLIISDSGGIQEEAPSFGKFVLITREDSERMEGIEKGYAELVGTNTASIVTKTNYYLDNQKKIDKSKNPYGDGTAAKKIVNYLSKI